MRLIRWTGGRARSVCGLALVGALGLGVLGAAFASRRSARNLSSMLGASRFPGYPSVAAEGSRGFDAVWADRAIMTARWSASTRKWSQAVALPGSVPGQWEPQVAGSPSGAGAIVWTQGLSSSPQEVQASYRPAGTNTWPRPVRIFSTSLENGVSEIAHVGMDTRGDAFAAWATSRGLYVAEHAAGATLWSAPVVIAHAGLEAFAVSPGGAAVAVWEHWLSGGISSASQDRVYVSVKPGQASWLRPLDLGPSGYYRLQGDGWIFLPHPQVAINARGTVFVVWQWPHRNRFYPRVAILTPTGHWRAPRTVELPTPGVNPVIAADDRGFATVLWEANGIEEADLSPNGRVLTTRALGPGGDVRLASSGKGDLAAVWRAAALRPAGQHWCPRIHLNAAEDDWSVAIAPNGVGQVVWEHWPGGNRGNVMLARTLRPCRAG